MKIIMFSVFLIVSLSGCVVGFGVASEPGPPRIESWVKSDTSAEYRAKDSKECGGTLLGSDFNDDQIEAERQPDELILAPLSRLHHKWERCMLRKGYQYTGQCYLDDYVSSARPACGAP